MPWCFAGGAYSIFAGRDASRGLATFALDSSAVKDTYDDLTDLSTSQMDTVKDWEQQFQGNSNQDWAKVALLTGNVLRS